MHPLHMAVLGVLLSLPHNGACASPGLAGSKQQPLSEDQARRWNRTCGFDGRTALQYAASVLGTHLAAARDRTSCIEDICGSAPSVVYGCQG